MWQTTTTLSFLKMRQRMSCAVSLTVNRLFCAVSSDSLSRAAYHSETPSAIDDLNEHLEGVVAYNIDTANIPVANSYGLCVCFANVSGSIAAQGRWVTQFALPTSGYPMWRRKTNQGDWTQWLYMAQ